MTKNNSGAKAPKPSIEREPSKDEESSTSGSNNEGTSSGKTSDDASKSTSKRSARASSSSSSRREDASTSTASGSGSSGNAKRHERSDDGDGRDDKRGVSEEASAEAIGFFSGFGSSLWRYASTHPHTVLYGIIGLVIAVLILSFGLWYTIVIGVCVLIGAAIGQIRDGDTGIIGFFARLFKDRP